MISNPNRPATPVRALPAASSAEQRASDRNCGVAPLRPWALDQFDRRNSLLNLFARQRSFHLIKLQKPLPSTLMPRIPKTELSPDNGCVIDMKWQLGPLSYHASAAGKEPVPLVTQSTRLPEIVLYDHVGFKGAYARTNLSFHYVGDFWNDRISCLIVVNGVWRFYRDDYYKGPYWDLGPGYYESFFAEKGPDDVVSSFQCIALT
jgi:hypothetical protein